ncbi:GNAT family N-acetyltransferase [Pantoea phytobeneficialis]|uniref:GNAT family N-acetyltransferase n=1 Tax=Pantoea phytobeneficialis TaxID=2052056 RepID=A0AAP9H3K0_9GAMM|nr:GNAT family N-acetyltransferase [Pantoea phytobeneficialis]MDO6409378.1 GNAT family N-acetyltransferase [Pantoea phytobeneficialis]QGR06035.1 GNAT family N-acetyltransferase [Pantoea phytobeneficialis]
MIVVTPESIQQPDAEWLLDRLSATLAQLTGSSGRASFDPDAMQQPGSCFVIARDEQRRPVGCGAFRPLQPGVAELKRMYALNAGQGIGAAILQYLEQQARAQGYQAMWLETRKVNQCALRFYARQAYQPIAPFGHYVGNTAAQCLGKVLD